VESEEVPEPEVWDPVEQLTTYLETLFESGENVGYVMQSWERDGRFLPTKGNWDRTAGELIQALGKANGDICTLGDYTPEAGAWIRFNPLDGAGCKNENVTEFRYALVESDSMPVGKQLAIIRQLELPAAVVVHSGKKSVHAIVRVDAPDYDEYRKRVDYLYDVCKKNGLAVDAQNKNPSRLSRLPGAMRGERKQFIVATNIGKESWVGWKAWIEESTDVLPVDVTSFDEEWDEELPDERQLVAELLANNEKMMLAGPPKAGKTVALLELACAVANGGRWMGAQCEAGDVLFVNFEIKRESRLRRVREIYKSMGYERSSAHRLHFLDLRGYSAPLKQLSDKIVRQTARYQCSLLVVDPIYKIMDGDENNAESVGRFCNQLDSLGRALNCSIVYCHHYSKGQQGQKTSMDRASGSGVFARDADALIAMTELEVTEAIRSAYVNDRTCEYIRTWLGKHGPDDWREHIGQDAWVVEKDFRSALREYLPTEAMNELIYALAAFQKTLTKATAFRLESTLRDFAPHEPINIWYRFPIHEIDETGVLKDAEIKDVAEVAARARKQHKDNAKLRNEQDTKALADAVEKANFGEPPTTAQAMEYMGLDPALKADKDKFDRILKHAKGFRRRRDEATNQWVIHRKGGTE
jgi:hypothetical protein